MKFKSTSQYTYNLTHTQQNSNKNIYKNNLRHVTDQDKKKGMFTRVQQIFIQSQCIITAEKYSDNPRGPNLQAYNIYA